MIPTNDHEKKNPGISLIRTENIETYLGEEDRPLFLAILRKDHTINDTLNQLEEIAAIHEKDDILVCYSLDDLLPYFTNRFGIGGTPTFVMILSGIITGSMLGKNSTASLTQFIGECIGRFRPVADNGRPQASAASKGLSEKGRPGSARRA